MNAVPPVETFSEAEAATQAVIMPPRFKPVMFADAIARRPTYNWVVKYFIPEHAFVCLYGPQGTGKSFFTIDMCIHVARGWSWRDRRVAGGAVVYIAGEGEEGIMKRFHAWVLEHGDPGQIPFVALTERVNLLDPAAEVEVLIGEIRRYEEQLGVPVRLIVVDTLARAIPGGNDADGADMGAFIDNAERVRKATSATMLVIHHTGKDVARGARGHSALAGAADTMVELSRDESGLIVPKVVKQKDGEAGDKFPFRLKRVVVARDEYEEEITSCVVVAADEEVRATKHGPILKGAAKVAYQLLGQALLDYGTKPATTSVPSGTTCVDWHKWREVCFARGLVMTDDDKVKERAFVNAAKLLRERAWIGVSDPWVWQART